MSFITADQLVAHAVGDYLLQSDWMAVAKTKESYVAVLHALFYTLPFLFFYPTSHNTGFAFVAIVMGHFILDHWRLARHVVWARNFIAPRSAWPPPFEDCKATGSFPDRPIWLTTWLLIIVDNAIHVLCNAAALYWL